MKCLCTWKCETEKNQIAFRIRIFSSDFGSSIDSERYNKIIRKSDISVGCWLLRWKHLRTFCQSSRSVLFSGQTNAFAISHKIFSCTFTSFITWTITLSTDKKKSIFHRTRRVFDYLRESVFVRFSFCSKHKLCFLASFITCRHSKQPFSAVFCVCAFFGPFRFFIFASRALLTIFQHFHITQNNVYSA